MIIFFIVVAIYISIRFEPKMALAAFIAMIHDVLVAIGIYSIFNFQVTPDTVVAILTILGYSLYDTVVVFDRVRDNTKGIGSSGRMTYPQLINLSMNQTLARSINTSAVAILPVLAVLLIGAQLLGATTLQSYGLALFVGLLSGRLLLDLHRLTRALPDEGARGPLDRHREPTGQAGRDGSVVLGRRRRRDEHPYQRGRGRPGEPGRGRRRYGCRTAVRRIEAQRADPAWFRQTIGEWRRRSGHGNSGHGPAGEWFGVG